jgi:hypothetical protein
MEIEETDDRSFHSPRWQGRKEVAPKCKQNGKTIIKWLPAASYHVLYVKKY